MAAVNICSDFGVQKNKVWHCFYCFPMYFPRSDGTGCHDFFFFFWMLSYKSTLSLSSFTFIKRLFSSSSPSATNPSQHQSFPKSQLFTWGGQSTGASALASFLPKKSQGWSLSEWTGWISLQAKVLSRVFSNTTVQKHQFFSAQLSSQSNSHIHTWLLEKPYPWLDGPRQSNVSAFEYTI